MITHWGDVKAGMTLHDHKRGMFWKVAKINMISPSLMQFVLQEYPSGSKVDLVMHNQFDEIDYHEFVPHERKHTFHHLGGPMNKVIVERLVGAVSAGKSASTIVENLIKTTSPLQVVQQAVLEAVMDYYAHLDPTEAAKLDPYLKQFDADPTYTVEKMMFELTTQSDISEATKNELLSIVTRFNLTIPR